LRSDAQVEAKNRLVSLRGFKRDFAPRFCGGGKAELISLGMFWIVARWSNLPGPEAFAERRAPAEGLPRTAACV